MKVFLSWSGETSHKVAVALHSWLPYMIQSLKPFLSSADIKKGDRWSDTLAMELQDTQYGIVCITPYNISKPWMNFEAGALSKIVGSSCVSPFLFRLDRSCMRGPLSQFQATVSSEDEVLNLILSLNNKLKPEDQLTYDLLRQNFKVWWEKLDKDLKEIKSNQEDETETEHDWLFSRNDLIRIEVQGGYKSIWIITPNPFEHALRSGVKEMVIENLKQGIRYKYIVPNSTELEDDIRNIREMAKPFDNQLVINEVNKARFETQAVTDYIIMHEFDASHKLRAFLKLPIGAEEYWIEVKDEHAAFSFMERFKEWAQGEKTSQGEYLSQGENFSQENLPQT